LSVAGPLSMSTGRSWTDISLPVSLFACYQFHQNNWHSLASVNCRALTANCINRDIAIIWSIIADIAHRKQQILEMRYTAIYCIIFEHVAKHYSTCCTIAFRCAMLAITLLYKLHFYFNISIFAVLVQLAELLIWADQNAVCLCGCVCGCVSVWMLTGVAQIHPYTHRFVTLHHCSIRTRTWYLVSYIKYASLTCVSSEKTRIIRIFLFPLRMNMKED